jgi:hypothetical protein
VFRLTIPGGRSTRRPSCLEPGAAGSFDARMTFSVETVDRSPMSRVCRRPPA